MRPPFMNWKTFRGTAGYFLSQLRQSASSSTSFSQNVQRQDFCQAVHRASEGYFLQRMPMFAMQERSCTGTGTPAASSRQLYGPSSSLKFSSTALFGNDQHQSGVIPTRRKRARQTRYPRSVIPGTNTTTASGCIGEAHGGGDVDGYHRQA